MTTPTVPWVGEGNVDIAGVAGWMVTCSALQPLTAGLLLESPLYEACHLKVPTWVVAYPAELALPPLNGTLAKPDKDATRLGPAHVVSPGPKSAKVTVPDGLTPPDTLALSLMITPTIPLAGAGVVDIAGEAGMIVTCSAPQALETGLLLASPLYLGTQLKVPV